MLRWLMTMVAVPRWLLLLSSAELLLLLVAVLAFAFASWN